MSRDEDKTPILLHPAKRIELLSRGQDLFNEERYFEAHEVWEDLWHLESGRDKHLVQGLIQVAAHLLHLRRGNCSGAESVGASSLEKLAHLQPSNRLYRELDLTPLVSAVRYNLGVIAVQKPESTPILPEAFLYPKLFTKS